MNGLVVFICVACCALPVLSQVDKTNENKPSATMDPAKEFPFNTTTATTTMAPNTTTATTTMAPNTTTASTTTATTTTATTTMAPNTTTATTTTATTTTATTTTATTTTASTTTAPTTTTATTTTASTTTASTTTASTTTAPAPTPTPSTNTTRGNYNVTKDNKICLRAEMVLKIRLQTGKENGTFIVQPKRTTAQGDCKETTANLTLVFTEGFITFLFNKSVSNDTVYVDSVSFSLSYPLVKARRSSGEPYQAKNASIYLFPTKVGHSYSCRGESIYMGDGLYLDISEDRMQAFNLTKSSDFGYPDVCPADQSDYRVAIAVGVTLLVLIVVVVIAYLVGRRRRSDGYQSL